MKKIIKKLEKIAEKHGAEELKAAIQAIHYPDIVAQGGPIDHECAEGDVWNPILKACVDDLG